MMVMEFGLTWAQPALPKSGTRYSEVKVQVLVCPNFDGTFYFLFYSKVLVKCEEFVIEGIGLLATYAKVFFMFQVMNNCFLFTVDFQLPWSSIN